MKKFKFTLQSVHDVRAMREEKEQQVFSAMQEEVNKAAAKVNQIDQLKDEAIEKYTSRLTKGVPINAFELEMNSNHIANLERLKKEAIDILEQKRQTCNKQRENLAAASQAVKVTDRLRENQEKRHKSDLNRKEQTAADELVSANFARQLTR